MKKKLSPLLILCAAICFSSGGLFVKSIPWGPFAINGGRSLIAVFVIFLYTRLRKHKIVVNKSVILCGLCMSLSSLTYVVSNKLTTAAAAIVLEYTAPLFIILFSFLFFRKKPDKLDVIVMPLIICGVICFFFDSLTATENAANPMLGNIIGLVDGMAYAVVFMMKMMPKSDNLSSIFFGCVFGSVIGAPFIVSDLMVPGHVSAEILGMMALLGAVQFASAYIFMAEGLEHTPAFAASLISTAEPILNPLLTAFFLKEVVGTLSLIGAVIVVGSILCYNLLKDRQEALAAARNNEIPE